MSCASSRSPCGTAPGRRALDAVAGVDLTVPSGSVVGLVGESGSGKSSLARAAVGLAPLTAGSIRLDGRDVTGRDADRRHPVQMVFQDPYSSLDPRMSIGASIAEAMRGVRGRSARGSEVARLLDLVSLDPGRAGLLPSALSGGQRQRVALARALAARPEVVIADEITSALDVSVQGAVLNLIRRIRRELGLSHAVHLAQPGRGALRQRRHRGDVPGSAGRGRPDRGGARRSAAPVYPVAAGVRAPAGQPADG